MFLWTGFYLLCSAGRPVSAALTLSLQHNKNNECFGLKKFISLSHMGNKYIATPVFGAKAGFSSNCHFACWFFPLVAYLLSGVWDNHARYVESSPPHMLPVIASFSAEHKSNGGDAVLWWCSPTDWLAPNLLDWFVSNETEKNQLELDAVGSCRDRREQQCLLSPVN